MSIYLDVQRVDSIVTLAKKYKLKVIEDAAEAIGSFYKGKHTGTFGHFGVISFNGNKSLTTGGGGVVITNNYNLASKIKFLSSAAKIKHKYKYIHGDVGYNYRLSNLNAALGCAQLEKIKKIIFSQRKLFTKYKQSFKDFKSIYILNEPKNSRSNFWLQTLVLKEKNKINIDAILKYINKKGFQVRPAWDLISEIKFYKKFPKMNLDQSKAIRTSIINLPSSPQILIK